MIDNIMDGGMFNIIMVRSASLLPTRQLGMSGPCHRRFYAENLLAARLNLTKNVHKSAFAEVGIGQRAVNELSAS